MNWINAPLLGNSWGAPWNIFLAIDLFLGGLAAGAFIVSAVATFIDEKRYKGAIRIGAFIAPIALILGLISLVIELDQPGRFWFLLFKYNSQSISWMTIGTWINVIFAVIAIIYALLWLNEREEQANLRRNLAVIGGIFAVAVATYTGLLLGANNVRALWNTSLLPILFFVSALVTGIGATLLFLPLSSQTTEEKGAAASRLGPIMAWLIIFELLVLSVFVVLAYTASVTSLETIKTVVSGNFASVFWIGIVIVGLLIPMILEFLPGTEETNLTVPLTAAILVLVGGFLLRYVIVFAGQALPL